MFSICILNLCFKSYRKFYVHFSTWWLTPVSEEWSTCIFKIWKKRIWKKNSRADKAFLYQWRMSFFSIRKAPQKRCDCLWMWPSFCHSSIQCILTPLSECWKGTVDVRYWTSFNSRAYSTEKLELIHGKTIEIVEAVQNIFMSYLCIWIDIYWLVDFVGDGTDIYWLVYFIGDGTISCGTWQLQALYIVLIDKC